MALQAWYGRVSLAKQSSARGIKRRQDGVVMSFTLCTPLHLPSWRKKSSVVMLEDQLRRALDRRREGGRLRALRQYDVEPCRSAQCSAGTISQGGGSGEGSFFAQRPSRSATHLIDFSSNDYMGLARCKAVQDSFLRRMKDANDASLPLGSTGSRLLDGNTTEHEELEARLKNHFDASSALLFNSGFDANCSLLSVLPQASDVIIYDELVHASMHDGMRTSRVPKGNRFAFCHNDPHSLARTIKNVQQRSTTKQDNTPANFFVAMESVYSMDGDLGPVAEIVETLDSLLPRGRRCLIVDEAHGVGLYGRRGAGIVSELGLNASVDIRLVTFGKALGCAGAAVLCSDLIKHYLVNYARPLVFSTALPNVALRLVQASLDVLCTVDAAQRSQKTFELVEAFDVILSRRAGLAAPRCAKGKLRPAPIIPVLTHRPRDLAAHLVEQGFLVRPITYPTVPRGSERVRVCIHANNDVEDVLRLGETIVAWLDKRQCSPVKTLPETCSKDSVSSSGERTQSTARNCLSLSKL